MTDNNSEPKTADTEIHGEIVLAETIPGYTPKKKKTPKREIDPDLVEAARRTS